MPPSNCIICSNRLYAVCVCELLYYEHFHSHRKKALNLLVVCNTRHTVRICCFFFFKKKEEENTGKRSSAYSRDGMKRGRTGARTKLQNHPKSHHQPPTTSMLLSLIESWNRSLLVSRTRSYGVYTHHFPLSVEIKIFIIFFFFFRGKFIFFGVVLVFEPSFPPSV